MDKPVFEKSISVCFSGHRKIPSDRTDNLCEKLDAAIEQLIKNGKSVFMAGGAIGFDTIAAFRVLAAKEKYPDIKLVLVLPCRDQTDRWTSLKSLNEYKILKDNADKVIYMKDFYDVTCMKERNKYMVDNSSCCVAYLTSASGGTAGTVKYAEKCGVPVINLANNNT